MAPNLPFHPIQPLQRIPRFRLSKKFPTETVPFELCRDFPHHKRRDPVTTERSSEAKPLLVDAPQPVVRLPVEQAVMPLSRKPSGLASRALRRDAIPARQE